MSTLEQRVDEFFLKQQTWKQGDMTKFLLQDFDICFEEVVVVKVRGIGLVCADIFGGRCTSFACVGVCAR